MSYYLGRSEFGRMRRLGDFLIALTLLVIALPLIIVIALAIKSESPGPILHRQSCIGYGGRRFQMLKFRTTDDSEHEAPGWNRKTTRVGLWLWWTRIESLPQLINVIRGEISILERDGRSPSFLD